MIQESNNSKFGIIKINSGLWLIICSTIVSIFIIFKAFEIDSVYGPVAILPAAFTIVLLLSHNHISFSSPGITVCLFVSILRYVITPWSIVTQSQFSRFARDYNYIGEAVILMIFEMAAIYLTICFYHPVFKRKYEGVVAKENNLIRYIIVIGVILIFIDNRNFIGSLSIIEGVARNVGAEELQGTSGIVTILWQAMSAFVFAYYTKKSSEKKAGKIVLALIIAIAYLLIIYTGQVSISRWYTLVSMIAIIFYMIKLFPNNKKETVLFFLIPGVILLITATILKNTVVGLGAGIDTTIQAIFSPTNMDTYFAGPVSVNNAIGVKINTNIGVNSLPYDVLNNFPGLNHIIDRTKSSVYLYTHYIYRNDQILPLLGQSSIWFSFILSPLLSVLTVMIFKNFDEKYRYTYDMFAYLYAFIAVWFALIPILNMTICLSWMYSRIIPAYLLFSFATRRIYNKTIERTE